jgi:hypothetical protein
MVHAVTQRIDSLLAGIFRGLIRRHFSRWQLNTGGEVIHAGRCAASPRGLKAWDGQATWAIWLQSVCLGWGAYFS